MKFDAERLYEIAEEELRNVGIFQVEEGYAHWAYYSSQEEYSSEEEVRNEIKKLIKIDKEEL